MADENEEIVPSPPSLPKRQVPAPPWIHLVAGGIGGSLAALITCPLDVVKTRMQAMNKEILTGAPTSMKQRHFGTQTWNTLRYIYIKEGVHGLWRGIGPNLVGIFPSRAIYFYTYAWCKQKLFPRFFHEENAIVHTASAVIAGVTVSTVTNPIWVVKTRMQLQAPSGPGAVAKYSSSFDCMRKMWREEGLRSFYKGLAASYVGTSETAIQFLIYEKLKASLQKGRAEAQSGKVHFSDVKLDRVEYFLAASAAKFVASALTYPHEVIRTRLREQPTASVPKYRGVFQGLMVIAREEGVLGLYGGAAAHIIRVVPNAAIMFLTVEQLTLYLHGMTKTKS